MDFYPHHSKIIFAVLNWGLGHATRSIPVIEKLLAKNNKVYLASDGIAYSYLKQHFPQLDIYKLPPYNIHYPYQSILINLSLQFYKPLLATFKEYKCINRLAKELEADYIISDNRYGCYTKNTKNIIITHQVYPYHPNVLVRSFLKLVSLRLLNSFQEIWVPDDENLKLSGRLSDYKKSKPLLRYIGIQSRMLPCNTGEGSNITFLLSGPEPQRTYLENVLLQLVDKHPQKSFVLVRGTDLPFNEKVKNNLQVVHLADTKLLNTILCNASLIVCRSGYSTLMDLIALHKMAILIPTPGQTEQEYLALHNQQRWRSFNQNKIYKLDLNEV